MKFQGSKWLNIWAHFFLGVSIHWRLHSVSWQPHLYQLQLHLLIVKCNLPNESAGCKLQQSVLLQCKNRAPMAQVWCCSVFTAILERNQKTRLPSACVVCASWPYFRLTCDPFRLANVKLPKDQSDPVTSAKQHTSLLNFPSPLSLANMFMMFHHGSKQSAQALNICCEKRHGNQL